MATEVIIPTKIKKANTPLFIDTGAVAGTPVWARIGKSTVFDLVLNGNIVTNDYIEDEMPTDEVTFYKPTIAQELQTIKGDKAFDYMYKMFYDLPVGEAVKKEVLVIFGGTDATGSTFKAWLCTCSIILKNFNTVEEKIYFDINFGGSIRRGTAVITAGQPVFTEVK